MENMQLFGTVLLLLYLSPAAAALLEIEYNQDSQLTCAQGLTDCTVKDGEQPRLDADPVQLDYLDVKALLCCRRGRYCRPCLRIDTHFTVPEESPHHSNEGFDAEWDSGSGKWATDQGWTPHQTEASIVVCYTPANTVSVCKVLEFTVPSAALEDQDKAEVWLSLVVLDKLTFGSHVYVSATPSNRSISLPSEQEGCGSSVLKRLLDSCSVPRVRAVIDHEKAVARLELDNKNMNRSFFLRMCLTHNEDCRVQHLNHTENILIPLHSVSPCLCVQVWWNPDALRVNSCPFANRTEFLRNISLSVDVVWTNRNDMALTWRLNAPCRVDADVWLCQRQINGFSDSCKEVQGTRMQLRKGNKFSSNEHWGKGEFVNIFPNPGLCVMAKVQDMSGELELRCPFAGNRKHWVFPIFVCALLLCLLILMSILLFNSLKRKQGGGHVVLLYPPDQDEALQGLMCWLGSWLSTVGFSVSGDLWSLADVCTLGPVPWLHSQLEHQRQFGGKVVLVLTCTTVQLAEEWMLAIEEGHAMPGKTGPRCSPYSDIFTAALGCILSDCLQGRVGERFTLVQFDLLPALPLRSSRPLPELFRGLTLYNLPSRSSDLIAELLATHTGSKTWALRLQASIQARLLGPRTLRGVRAHRLSGLSQDSGVSVLSSLQETVPLQPSPSP
ncbi:interleukin-17 receptor C-like isoform X1 [Arapaima gigas]